MVTTSKVGIIVQARMASKRLPNKVLLKFYNDVSILEIIIDKLRLLDLPIIVATSISPSDDVIEAFCKDKSIDIHRGPEEDVLQRFLEASKKCKFDYIVRVCADNPLLDVESIFDLLKMLVINDGKSLDYLSYRNEYGTPSIKTHWGLFAEIVSRSSLESAMALTDDKLYREHVTNFIYGNPEIFNVSLAPAPQVLIHRDDLRFTIDTPEDFENIQAVYAHFAEQPFQLAELIQYVDEDPFCLARMKSQISLFKK